MLAEAKRDSRIDYLRCPSEVLPLPDQSFGLLTVSSGLHWFERNAFLAEAYRILQPRGWLVIYDNFFSANLQGNPGFRPWFVSTYFQRFPTPPRDNRPLDHRSARHAGFQLVKEENYGNVVYFDRKQLIDYLLTQTNVIAAIERGEATLRTPRLTSPPKSDPTSHQPSHKPSTSADRSPTFARSASPTPRSAPCPAASAASRTSAGTP